MWGRSSGFEERGEAVLAASLERPKKSIYFRELGFVDGFFGSGFGSALAVLYRAL